jgi:hypothetical protein
MPWKCAGKAVFTAEIAEPAERRSEDRISRAKAEACGKKLLPGVRVLIIFKISAGSAVKIFCFGT